jgi:hypothetical protein
MPGLGSSGSGQDSGNAPVGTFSKNSILQDNSHKDPVYNPNSYPTLEQTQRLAERIEKQYPDMTSEELIEAWDYVAGHPQKTGDPIGDALVVAAYGSAPSERTEDIAKFVAERPILSHLPQTVYDPKTKQLSKIDHVVSGLRAEAGRGPLGYVMGTSVTGFAEGVTRVVKGTPTPVDQARGDRYYSEIRGAVAFDPNKPVSKILGDLQKRIAVNQDDIAKDVQVRLKAETKSPYHNWKGYMAKLKSLVQGS